MRANSDSEMLRPFMAIKSFLFIVPAPLTNSCCFRLFPLRSAARIIAILDILEACICFIIFLVFVSQFANLIHYFWSLLLWILMTLSAIPAIIAICGTMKNNYKKVTIYYYWKLIMLILKAVIEGVKYKVYLGRVMYNLIDFIAFLFILIAYIILYIYEAYILYSYINNISQGSIPLVNRGEYVNNKAVPNIIIALAPESNSGTVKTDPSIPCKLSEER